MTRGVLVVSAVLAAASFLDVPSLGCSSCSHERRLPPSPSCGAERRCEEDALPFAKIAKTLQATKLTTPTEREAMVQIAEGLEQRYVLAKRRCEDANRCVINEKGYATALTDDRKRTLEWQAFADSANTAAVEPARRLALALLYARIVSPEKTRAIAVAIKRTEARCPDSKGVFERVELTATAPVHFYVLEREADRYFASYPQPNERARAAAEVRKSVVFDDHRTACAGAHAPSRHRADLYVAASRSVLGNLDHALPSIERSKDEGALLFASPPRGVVLPKGESDAGPGEDEIVLLSEAGDDAISMHAP